MDFEETRAENDELLLGKIERVASGTDIDALEPFARAYLGLFLDIDGNIAPRERIAMLANPKLAAAVIDGFAAALERLELPSAAQIGDALVRGEPFIQGFIVLAGMDIVSQRDERAVLDLNESTLAAALCFHYANSTYHEDPWLETLLRERPQLSADTLLTFWEPQVRAQLDALPGLSELLADDGLSDVLGRVLIPLLKNWQACTWRTQRKLLLAALRYGDHRVLAETASERLEHLPREQVRKYTFWLATAFLLEPKHYAGELQPFCGRSKEKILPLLDFVTAVLTNEREFNLHLTPLALAELIHVIAPRFAPQEDRYGQLSENTERVLSLFDRLAADHSDEAIEAVDMLRGVRVMGIYSDKLDDIAARQARANNAVN